MKAPKLVLAGIAAVMLLSLAGCGSKGEEAGEAAASVETEKAGGEQKDAAGAEAAGAGAEDGTFDDLADIVGEKAAKLLGEMSEEERAALIPDTEVTVSGYYINWYGNPEEFETTGYMKEYEVVQQDWECIMAKGVIVNEAFQTEEAVNAVYYLSVNEEETEVILRSASTTDEAEKVHIIPTKPLPEAEELLDKDVYAVYTNANHYPLTRDNVTDIWYDKDVNNEGVTNSMLTDWGYEGEVSFIVEGVEIGGWIMLYYSPYENKGDGWVLDDQCVGSISYEEEKVLGLRQ